MYNIYHIYYNINIKGILGNIRELLFDLQFSMRIMKITLTVKIPSILIKYFQILTHPFSFFFFIGKSSQCLKQHIAAKDRLFRNDMSCHILFFFFFISISNNLCEIFYLGMSKNVCNHITHCKSMQKIFTDEHSNSNLCTDLYVQLSLKIKRRKKAMSCHIRQLTG